MSKSTNTTKAPQKFTKKTKLIELLSCPEGVTIDHLGLTLGWLPHTTRAALTGLRKSGYALQSQKNDSGKNVYTIISQSVEAA